MGKNFLERQEELRQASYEAGFEEGVQYAQDCMVSAMREDNMVSKPVVEKILKVFAEKFEKRSICFNPKHPEADYQRELLDRDQIEVFGEKAEAFEKRYPYALKIRYDKPCQEKHHKRHHKKR